MISDDERKRVAANLRQYLKKYETPDWRAFCNIILGSGRLDNLRKAQAFDRLADLIDRPTCSMEYRPEWSGDELCPTRAYECSVCGHIVMDGKPDYCPGCGAEVVGE